MIDGDLADEEIRHIINIERKAKQYNIGLSLDNLSKLMKFKF